MATRDFYAALPALDKFLDLANPENYAEVPEDWYVLITDIASSTEAIAAGKYKEVNLLGASSIIAVLNVIQPLEVPFVFGGDGACLLVPPDGLHVARAALLGVRSLAWESFGMDLRVGVVPVATVSCRFPLKLAKFRLSPHYCQASFTGGGITYATELIKTDPTYCLDRGDSAATANLSGLECRWQDIPSPYGDTLSLIVAAMPGSRHSNESVYREVLTGIQQIYGDSQNYHPVTASALKLSLDPRRLQAEIKARVGSQRSLRWLVGWVRILSENLLGKLLMNWRLSFGGLDWGRYKQDVCGASDYQKIDDLLRMVISGTAAQTAQLNQYLEKRFQSGQLVYGIHVSDRALMTCLIMDRRHQHFHLIDSADGGYAIAAKMLKARLHHKARNWKSFMSLLPCQSAPRPAQKSE